MHKPITLLALTSLLLITPVQAQPQAPAVVLQKMSAQLNSSMEAQLEAETGRARVGFEASWQAVKDGAYVLQIPSHVQRDTYLNVRLSFHQQRPVLSGEVLNASDKKILLQAVQSHFGLAPEDKLDVFPFEKIDPDFGLVKVPSADLYVQPRVEAGENLATQARLGTPVRILAYSADGKLARVRVEDDGYIAWIKRSDLQEGAQDWFQDWLQKRKVLMLAEQEKPLRIPFGTRLKLISQNGKMIQAALPDGTAVNLSSNDLVLSEAGKKLPSADKILATARQYLPQGPQGGGKYLWGGTLGRNLDCSGFVQTVYRVNGVYLPRDADQQKSFTRPVGNTLKDIDELQPGDLVFFSSHGKWPTHVGLYLGNGQFIHSSSKGQYNGVKISSLRGKTSYDLFLQKIYYGGGRVVRSL